MTTAKLVIIVKILLTIILIGTICAITLIIYLFKGDVKAKVPGYVKKEYNLNKYEVENRPIYVMNSKKGITNELVIMYIHGGSYVGDLEKEHWKTCGDIVNKLGCTIILPDYPLTPKYNYKDTFNMMEALYKKVINKVDSAKFVASTTIFTSLSFRCSIISLYIVSGITAGILPASTRISPSFMLSNFSYNFLMSDSLIAGPIPLISLSCWALIFTLILVNPSSTSIKSAFTPLTSSIF